MPSRLTGCSVVSALSSSTRQRSDGGFTLLELLIAFAILAMGLAALIQAFSHGIHASRAAEDRAIAMMLARSKLAEVGKSIPLEEGELADEFSDGFEWRLVIGAMDNSEVAFQGGGAVQLYDVRLSIARNDKELLELHSLRLGPSP